MCSRNITPIADIYLSLQLTFMKTFKIGVKSACFLIYCEVPVLQWGLTDDDDRKDENVRLRLGKGDLTTDIYVQASSRVDCDKVRSTMVKFRRVGEPRSGLG